MVSWPRGLCLPHLSSTSFPTLLAAPTGVRSDQLGDLGLDLLVGFRKRRCSPVEQRRAPRLKSGLRTRSGILQLFPRLLDCLHVACLEHALSDLLAAKFVALQSNNHILLEQDPATQRCFEEMRLFFKQDE